jgi:hypothetical protein
MFGKISFLLFVMLAAFHIAEAQKVKSDKLNVLDYYKLEPDNALASEAMQAKLTITDLKNGYLKIEGAFEGYIEVALFRKKDKSPILVISKTSCGPVCHSEVSAYTHKDGKMIDITETTLPRPSEPEINAIYNRKKKTGDDDYGTFAVPLVYELPQIGRTITIKADQTFAPSDITIFKLDFKNDKFVIIK